MKAISISTNVLFLFAAGVFCGCNSVSPITGNNFSYFTAVKNFSNFTESQNEKGETLLLSPEVKSPIPWNQLVVSWNASVPSGTFLKIEAFFFNDTATTEIYTIANWSSDNKMFQRTSVRGQEDADGTM